MAAPTYVKASTGTTDASGAWSHTGMTPAAAGNIIILQVLVDGTTAGIPTVTSVTNILEAGRHRRQHDGLHHRLLECREPDRS